MLEDAYANLTTVPGCIKTTLFFLKGVELYRCSRIASKIRLRRVSLPVVYQCVVLYFFPLLIHYVFMFNIYSSYLIFMTFAVIVIGL